MLSNEVSKIQNRDYELILQDDVNRRVLETLETYANLLIKRGCKAKAFSHNAVLKLDQVPTEKKLEICANYGFWNQWLQANENIEINDEDLYKSFLKRALDHFGYWIHDEFWKVLNKEEVLEFYGENMTQLYRSINFFEYSGYSILDLCIHEWFVLWERPKRTLEDMHKHVSSVTTAVVPAAPFIVRKHLLREVYCTGDTEPFVPVAMLVDFKFIGSLMRGLEPDPKGFIVTCKAEVIAEGAEALDIQLI